MAGGSGARLGVGPLETLTRDARAWRVDERLAWTLFLLPVLGTAVVAATALGRVGRYDLFSLLTAEDRLLEWAEVFAFAVAAACAALLAATLRRTGDLAAAAAFALLAAGAFFAAGEEISWGQRLFGWGTPETLRDVNYKDETNVHNIESVRDVFRVVLVGVGLYGTIVPWLAGRRGVLSRRRRLAIPAVFLTSFFAVVVAYFVPRLVFDPSNVKAVDFSEWPEFCLAAAVALHVALCLRLVRAR